MKKNKVRICLDPGDLNKAILREHYPMKTLKEIAQRLHGTKWFTTLDATSGYWKIELDDKSSKLCTMIKPYGRYRFKRMPFEISSAPEVFQRVMYEDLQGLKGAEVVVDNILVTGRDKKEHHNSLRKLLERCHEVGIKLNKNKL